MFDIDQNQPIDFTGAKVTCTRPGQIGIEASQDMQVDAIIQTYLSTIMEKLGETVMVQDTEATETTTNTQSGGFDNWAFVVMIVVCVVVVGLLVALMSKKGGAVAQTLASRQPAPAPAPAPVTVQGFPFFGPQGFRS